MPGQTAATLTLLNVTTNDAGNYDVVVTNLVGSATSAPPAVLTVNITPFIAAPLQNQTVTVGSNVSFTVIAGGTAPLSFQWRKAGFPLAGQMAATLALLAVIPGDAGVYDVIVTNMAGRHEYAAGNVDSERASVYCESPLGKTVVEGTNASFSVVAGGTLPLGYQWRKGGSPLTGQTSATLAWLSVTTNDAGSYDVVVTNVAVGRNQYASSDFDGECAAFHHKRSAKSSRDRKQ